MDWLAEHKVAVGVAVVILLIAGYILLKKKEGFVTYTDYLPFTQGLNASNVGGDYADSIKTLSALEGADRTAVAR
jgi:hypothetical protein